MSLGEHHDPFRTSLWIRIWIQAGPEGMWVLAYRYIKWGLVSKLLREGVLIAPLNTRYAQLEFNLISV